MGFLDPVNIIIGIIVGIIGIIGVIYGILKIPFLRFKKIHALYRINWRKTTRLTPEDILGIRASDYFNVH